MPNIASSPVAVDGRRQTRRPFLVIAAGTGSVAPDPRRLEESHLTEGARRVAEVVLEDVGAMDAGVERQRAGQLLVPPGGDEERVAATDRRLHHELPFADRAVVEQRPHQPVDRIAPVVLGDGQDLPAPLGRGDDPVAAADGQRQRLLAKGMQSQVEQVGGDAVVRAGVGGAGRCRQSLDGLGHLRSVGEDGRSVSEEARRLVGEIGGVAVVQIADRDQIDGPRIDERQLGQPRQVAPSHPAAADDRQPNRFRHELSFLPRPKNRTPSLPGSPAASQTTREMVAHLT